MNTDQRRDIAKQRENDAARVLARLRQGPATMRELLTLTVGYRQRISQLRADGYLIRCTRTPTGSVFTLIGHKDAAQLSLLGAA